METPKRTLSQLLDAITPEIHEQLKRAVELGRWPDGGRLTAAQRELCLQAVIAYDVTHKPEAERVGYVQATPVPHCDADADVPAAQEPAPIRWRH